jgi:TRAP-type mannitol/chloroaromatic compound transport system substrate-binding protein
MHRRTFLATVGAVTATAATTHSVPVVGQGVRELKLVTSWPKGSPGLGSSAERLAQLITSASGGRLQVKVFGAGELVDAFEVFDAVSAGVADMYHSAEYYWQNKSTAFNFFAAVPFGFTADEMATWIYRGGGQPLWDELSASFNIKALLATNTGVQMGGWFNEEVTSIESYKGLRYRMPGLGGEVLKRLGATVVNLPGFQIFPSMQSGAIDAAEWVGPWLDLELGLYRAAKYYYYPGIHEPGTAIALGVNKKLWDGLAPEDRRLIEISAAAEYNFSLADFNAENGVALKTLTEENGIQVRRFDDSFLREFGKISEEVLAEIGASDPMTKRVYESFLASRESLMQWGDVSERAFLNARSLALS